VNPHHSSPPSPLAADREIGDMREVREIREMRAMRAMRDRDHDADIVDAVAGSEFVDDLIRLRDDDQG
jgi:hypothetical protein